MPLVYYCYFVDPLRMIAPQPHIYAARHPAKSKRDHRLVSQRLL